VFHALLGGTLVRVLSVRAGKWLVGAIGTGVVFGAFVLSLQLLQAMLKLPDAARPRRLFFCRLARRRATAGAV
jgi:hypothetical protein